VLKGDWDIDEKCPIVTCNVHAGNGERMNEHISNRHKNSKKQIKTKLPPFWKFLKINARNAPAPNFFDFLNITKHPWLNYQMKTIDPFITEQI
jgi:hypothetical protein